MGITDATPDEDLLGKICVLDNEIKIELSGIDMAYSETVMTTIDIKNIQSMAVTSSKA